MEVWKDKILLLKKKSSKNVYANSNLDCYHLIRKILHRKIKCNHSALQDDYLLHHLGHAGQQLSNTPQLILSAHTYTSEPGLSLADIALSTEQARLKKRQLCAIVNVWSWSRERQLHEVVSCRIRLLCIQE